MGGAVTLFLAGDVMTGRGIDQILEHPGHPRLHEPYIQDAAYYVTLAERVSGGIPRRAPPAYVWGELLEILERASPAARLVNLETAITHRGEPWRGKDIHYRMHPANVGCLRAARLDVVSLANNHVLDWDRDGLVETLATLREAGIAVAGAGLDAHSAREPAVVPLPAGGRLLVFGFGCESSGIPSGWGAGRGTPGIEIVDETSPEAARAIAERVRRHKRPGDLCVASIHWGENWGYEVPQPFVSFAHALVEGGVDVVHGHSSHHPRAMEVHRGKLILYGCGDLINDYEGIGGHQAYRPELVLGYLPTLDAEDGRLLQLRLIPLELQRLRLNRASTDDARWLAQTLSTIGRSGATRFELASDGALELPPPA